MLPEMKLDMAPVEQLRHLHKSYRGVSYLLSHWAEEREGRRYLVVVWHDVPRIVHDLFPALYGARSAEPRQRGRRGGTHRLRPAARARRHDARAPVRDHPLQVDAERDSMASAEELAAAVARRRVLEMVLVGLSIVVVIAGLFVILVAAARERKLSTLKSEFVANVSHELKTPLALVRMFGELLQSGRVDSEEKRRQYLPIIVSESERLGALIENVLDFAKVERGKQRLRLRARATSPTSWRAPWRPVECAPSASQVALELRGGVDACRLVRLDERAVEIAVINLVDNALKYAPEGKRASVSVNARTASKVKSRRRPGPGHRSRRPQAHLRALRARQDADRQAGRAAAASGSRW